MPGVVTRRFRTHNANQFKEAFDEAAYTTMYVYLARPIQWTDENSPPTPSDTVQTTYFDNWRNMIALKRCTSSDVSYVIPRYNWTSGTVYTAYDDTTATSTLFAAQFYVMTTDYNVYKCLSNNNGGISTVKPTGTGTSIITTSDNYQWKFLYNISAADALKFVTTSYIPVKTLTANDASFQWDVQQAAANGGIEIVKITANGTGYLTANGTIASVVNSTVLTLSSGGGVSSTDNIYNGSSLYISSGLGSGQIRTVVDYTGSTRTIKVSPAFTTSPNTTSRFHVGPTITFRGDGTGAKAYANVVSGQIRKINMISVGSQFSKANVTITANSSQGSGATARPVLAPLGGHGSRPVDELGGFNVMLNVKITGSESNTFPTTNDFRTIGVIRDPKLANGTIATSTVVDQTLKIRVNTKTGTFTNDEFVYAANGSARIIYFANTNTAGSNGEFRLTNVNGNFTVGQTITANTSGGTARVIGVTQPTLKPYTGDIIYVENRSVVTRAEDQIEDIKLVVKF